MRVERRVQHPHTWVAACLVGLRGGRRGRDAVHAVCKRDILGSGREKRDVVVFHALLALPLNDGRSSSTHARYAQPILHGHV